MPWRRAPTPSSYSASGGQRRLVRVEDGTELFARPLEHEGATRVFSAWADDNAASFRTALMEAVEALVRAVETAGYGARIAG